MDKKESNIADIISELNSDSQEATIGAIKLKLSLFPVVGPLVNELLFDLPGRIRQGRINQFVVILGEMIAKIDSEKINLDYIRSDEFFDLTTKVFENSLKISTDAKRKALASVYSSAIADEKIINHDQQIIFADFITTMTPAHIHIINFVSKNESKLVEIGTYEKYLAVFNEHYPNFTIDKYEFKYYTTDLELKSLISTGAGLGNFDDTSSISAWNDHKEPSIKLTTIGNLFLKFLVD
jgi:hypothetical protein